MNSYIRNVLEDKSLNDYIKMEKLSEDPLRAIIWFEKGVDLYLHEMTDELWDYVSGRNEEHSEDFLEKYKDKLNWYKIHNQVHYDCEIIDKYSEYYNSDTWLILSYNNSIFDPKFLRKYKDKLNWDHISRRGSKVPLWVIKEYKEYIHMDKFVESFLHSYKDIIEEYYL